jgi:hypothetical protein
MPPSTFSFTPGASGYGRHRLHSRVDGARAGMAGIWQWMKIVRRSERSNRFENALN